MKDGHAAPSLLRSLPKVDRLLSSASFRKLAETYPRRRVVTELRETLDHLRDRGRRGRLTAEDLEPEAIHEVVQGRLALWARPYYERVINATGVILHTGLGRAPLSPRAARALEELAVRPQRIEIDLETGKRGGRDRGCDLLIRELTGCEAAIVVNNNAAVTILILAAIARGRRVLLSRGELVEIGGSFRIPEIMSESGAILAEVGTTNRTHERDYRQAVDEETGMILKVHTSNYRVMGFTKEVDLPTLVALGREHGVPVVHDLGSGCLIDLASRGRPGEDLVRASIAAGCDLVCFSGDKLLGGPQAGIIAGKKDAVDRCRRHPLLRAMRPGRLIYTALEATLRLYLEDRPVPPIPILEKLLTPRGELRRRARRLARRCRRVEGFEIHAVESLSQAGSGSLPAREYPSWAVSVEMQGLSAEDLARELRRGRPPILPRIREDVVLLDLRTLDDDDFPLLEARLAEIAQRRQPAGGTPGHHRPAR